MSIATTCPNCQGVFRLGDELAGKKVKCQKCQTVFAVPTADEKGAPEAGTSSGKRPAIDMELDPKPQPAQAKAAPMANDEEPLDGIMVDDDEPARPSGKKPPPPPTGKKPLAKPPLKTRRSPADSGSSVSMTALLVLLLGGGLLSCVGCFGAVGWWFYAESPAKPDPAPGPIAAAENKDVGNKDRAQKGFDKKVDDVKDRFPPDGKIVFPKFDGQNFDGPPPFDPFKDKNNKKPPPLLPPPGGVNVVLGPDGSYRSENVLNPQDPVSQFAKRHKLYQVQMAAGQTYQIDLITRSNGYDPYLYLVDDRNQLVAQDDDSGGFPNARIVFKAPRAGRYYIHATHFGFLQGAANFTLIVSRVGSGPIVKEPPKIDPPDPKVDPNPKTGPDLKAEIGKSVVANTLKLGDFTAKEITLKNLLPGGQSATEPCWDAQGKSVFWLQGGSSLYKMSRDGKIEAVAALPNSCNHLVLSAEGLLTVPLLGAEVWLIDPQTLAVRSKVRCPIRPRWVAAAPASSMAVVLCRDVGFVDLKQGNYLDAQVMNAPVPLTNAKGLGLSPDGKFLCVQTTDFQCHRFRVEANQLTHEASKVLGARALILFQFSSDSKHVTLTHPTFVPKTKNDAFMAVYQMRDWENPAYTIPGYHKLAAFDADGRLYAVTDKNELRYYPKPAEQNDQFQALALPFGVIPRRLVGPPRGAGCLLAGTQQRYLIEPASKN